MGVGSNSTSDKQISFLMNYVLEKTFPDRFLLVAKAPSFFHPRQICIKPQVTDLLKVTLLKNTLNFIKQTNMRLRSIN